MRSRALAPPTNYPRAVLPLITSLLQRRLLAGAAASGRPKRKARMRPSLVAYRKPSQAALVRVRVRVRVRARAGLANANPEG